MGKWHRYYSILKFNRNRKLNFTLIDFFFYTVSIGGFFYMLTLIQKYTDTSFKSYFP